MATKQFNARIGMKRDTASKWEQNNPVLLNGEIIIVDTASGEVRFKVGDGTKLYTQLPFSDEAVRALISEQSGAVRYDVAQSLTDANKQQARSNIGAGTPYELPIATSTQLGGVKPVAKTDTMTKNIGVDGNGKLYAESAEVYYIDLAGSYPNYTCPVAIADINEAYQAGKVLKCRCVVEKYDTTYTAVLPLFMYLSSTNTWVFSSSISLIGINFPSQLMTIAIGSEAVELGEDLLASVNDIPTTLPNPHVLTINSGSTSVTYNGRTDQTVTVEALYHGLTPSTRNVSSSQSYTIYVEEGSINPNPDNLDDETKTILDQFYEYGLPQDQGTAKNFAIYATKLVNAGIITTPYKDFSSPYNSDSTRTITSHKQQDGTPEGQSVVRYRLHNNTKGIDIFYEIDVNNLQSSFGYIEKAIKATNDNKISQYELTASPTTDSQIATKLYVDDKVKSTIISATLTATDWQGASAPYTYTLSVSGVTATSNQEFLPALEITDAQLTALQSANIQDGGQAANSVILKAFGDKPTIDVPIRLILRGDS